MANLDELLKTQQEATKHLAEIVKHLAKAGGSPGDEPGYAGKKGPTLWSRMQQFRAGSNLGMGGIAKGMMGGGWGAAGQKGGGLSGLGKAGIAAGAISGVASLAIELAKLPWHVKDFAEGLHQANRVFANFSPAMAQVFAMSDWRDTIRNIQQGDKLARGAGQLADARGDLLDKLEPVDTARQNAMNKTGEFAARFAEKFVAADVIQGFFDRHSRGMERLGKMLGLQMSKAEQDQKHEWVKEMEFIEYAEELKRQGRSLPVNQPFGGPSAFGPAFQHLWERNKKMAEGGF